MKPTYVQAIIEENDNLKLEIAELRQALTGRTVSCHACNQSAMERDMLRENIHEALEEIKELTKERDDICEAVRDFAAQERLFACRACVRTDVTYGDERPSLWRKAFRKLCRMVNVKQ